MSKKQKIKIQLEELILTVKKKLKPKTEAEPIGLSGQTYTHPREKMSEVVTQTENQSKTYSANKTDPNSVSLFKYVFSSKAIRYWVIIVLAVASVATTFSVPENVYPLNQLRAILGLILVLFLPGFTFMKALFPYSVPIKTSTEYFDVIELVILSLGASIVITPMVGLMLYYSPWGMGQVPTTLSLLGLIVFFTTIAMLREHRRN